MDFFVSMISKSVPKLLAVFQDPTLIYEIYSRLVATDGLVASQLQMAVRGPTNQDWSILRKESDCFICTRTSLELQEELRLNLTRFIAVEVLRDINIQIIS